MRPEPANDADDASAQARAWLTLLHSGEATDGDRERFLQWLRAPGENASAYKRVEQVWESVPLVTGIENSAPRIKQRAGVAQRIWLPAIGALAACLLVAVGLNVYDPVERQTVRTGVGEIRTVHLSDGSDVILGPDTTISAAFSRGARRVTLAAGQAYFDVARDETRVFSVAVESTEVRVLGTAFDVLRGPTTVTVSVVRGRVEVADRPDGAGADQAADILTRGQRVMASLDGALSEISAIDPDKALNWRNGRLTYVDAPFDDVVADLNRYLPQPITVEAPGAGQLPVTASFDVQQYRDILAGFASANGLEVHESPEGVAVRALQRLTP